MRSKRESLLCPPLKKAKRDISYLILIKLILDYYSKEEMNKKNLKEILL
jgi:hypothetical protein